MLLVSLCKFKFHPFYKSCFVGKTTIADALVASNGIISQRMAGKVSLLSVIVYSTSVEHVYTWNINFFLTARKKQAAERNVKNA